MFRAVHQILPYLAYGDAVGNQVMEFRRLLRAWGYPSEIYVENCDPRLTRECRPYRDYVRVSHPRNLLLLHYSTGGESNLFTLTLPDQVVLYYHNLTPAHFFYRYNGVLARSFHQPRRDLVKFVGRVQVIAASPYNQQELEALGFQVTAQVPYILALDQLEAGLESSGAMEIRRKFVAPDLRTWLYVGRLVPNKCIEDLIRSFYYYHHWIDSRSRLLLIGGATGTETYVEELERLIARLHLQEAVVFAGHYGAAEGLAAFYQLADVYISMSEHEGFCIPLVEAMHFGLPVLAYASTGVPYTLNGTGVLFHRKEYPVIAEVAHEVITNATLRARLARRQQVRLADFEPDRARAQFRECLDVLAAQASGKP
jgi:glycosyltransferase involved in cell wall biosynthesis